MNLTSRSATVHAAVLGIAALCLSGCISLLPKEKPVQMYRFGAGSATVAPATPSVATGPRFTVRAAPISFDRAAATDRILTVTGDRTAYISGARWVTSASSLFEAAVTRAFQTQGRQARLLAQGEPSAADLVLKLDVRTFEARYAHGPGSAPTVAIEVYAALVDRKDPANGGSRVFQATSAAGSNSVHAIAEAFDAAVATVLGQITTWANARGQG